MPRTFPPSDCQSVRFVLYWISYSGKTRSCPTFVTVVGQVSSSRGPLEVRTIGKGSAAGTVPQSDKHTSPMSESLIGIPAFMPHCNHKIWFLVKRKPRSRRQAFVYWPVSRVRILWLFSGPVASLSTLRFVAAARQDSGRISWPLRGIRWPDPNYPHALPGAQGE